MLDVLQKLIQELNGVHEALVLIKARNPDDGALIASSISKLDGQIKRLYKLCGLIAAHNERIKEA